MPSPNISHASICTDPKVELTNKYALWESRVGTMYRFVYGCPTCGKTVGVGWFEAVEMEEED